MFDVTFPLMIRSYVTLLGKSVSHLPKRYTNICECIYNLDVPTYDPKVPTYDPKCQEDTGLRPVFPWRIWCSEIQKNAKYFFGKCLFWQVAKMENVMWFCMIFEMHNLKLWWLDFKNENAYMKICILQLLNINPYITFDQLYKHIQNVT